MSDERPGGGGLGAAFVLLIFVGAVAKFWIWILVVLGVIALGVVLGWLMWRWSCRVDERYRAAAAVAARADEQHRQLLAGDDRGLYGIFPPADPPPPPVPAERLPRAGENWSDYLAEQRKRALAT